MKLGEAWRLGWVCTAHCYWFGDSKHGQRIPFCDHSYRLDMTTLVWTRGQRFPLDRLSECLRCPKCGQRNVRVLVQPPALPMRAAYDR
jgi:hypothetical protein